MENENNCACGRKVNYTNCCKRAHIDIFQAKTAEDLMRSRYTAFTMANGDYLMKSQHSATRHLSEKVEIEKWSKSVKWIKLEVLNSSQGTADSNYGTVEFKAFFMSGGQIDVIHENSTFQKENNHWVYVGALD